MTDRSPKRKLARRAVAVAILLGLGMVLFHQPLLRSAFGLLVVDQTPDEGDLAMIVSTDRECFDATAEMVLGGRVARALIVDQKPRRSVKVGAVRAHEEWVELELTSRGLAKDQCRIINTDAMTPHQLFRDTDAELRDEVAGPFLVVCIETKSRYFRTVIDQALPSERARLYQIDAIASKRTYRANWWQSRAGVRQVMIHGLRTLFVWGSGESDVDATDHYQDVVARAAT